MRAPHTLVITALSPILVGTGLPDDLDVDAAMQVDHLGLPLLARRQLVARLRDAGQRVSAAFSNEGEALGQIIETLLGGSGELGATRVLHLSDAVLPLDDQNRAKQQLEGLEPRERRAARIEVAANYTFEESRTALDDDAAPRTGSLRSARLGKPGLEFTAVLSWDRAPSDDEVTVLARLCLALQQVGGGESRGLGQAELALDGNRDRTRVLASRHLTGAQAPASEAQRSVPLAATGESATGYVTLTLHQQAPIALGSGSGANYGQISGTALRGAVYRAVRSSPDARSLLVESGIVRYGQASVLAKSRALVVAPALDTVTQEDEYGALVPKDVLHDDFGDDDRFERDILHDALDRDDTSSRAAVQSTTFEWLRAPVTADGAQVVRVPTENVQRLNRGQQLYFESETLPTGHTFEAELELVGSPSQVEAAHQALLDLSGTTLRVGSNAEAFGGDLLLEVDSFVDEVTRFPRAISGASDGSYHLAVVLASPALVRDAKTGGFHPGALPEAVAAQWRAAVGDGWAVRVDGHAVQGASIGGFNQLFGGLRPEHQAAAAGSVVHVVLEPEAGTQSEPQIPTGRLGDRTVDGFGQWQVRQHLAESIELGELRHDLRVRDAIAEDDPLPGDPDLPSYADGLASTDAPDVLEVGFTLTLLSDTALGDGSRRAETPADEQDDPEKGNANRLALYRDADGSPSLRGTTMAGVVRHYLRRRLGIAPGMPDPDSINALLGFTKADGTSARSRVRFDTHPAKLPAEAGSAFRAHNRVDPQTGTVADKALYFREVLPAGTTFDCVWTVDLPTDLAQARELLATLAAAAEGFSRSAGDGMRLGARSGKGQGVVSASDWTVRAYDTRTPEGFLAYFGNAAKPSASDQPTGVSLLSALTATSPKLAGSIEPIASAVDAVTLSLTFKVAERLGGQTRPGTVRHGTGKAVKVPRPAGKDDTEKSSDLALLLRRPVVAGAAARSVPIDPGSAWHAAFKRHAFRIAVARATGSLDDARRSAAALVESIFGALNAEAGRGGAPRPSRVRVTERELKDGVVKPITRNRLDPLTQGTIAGALFTEEVVYGGKTEVTVTVARPARDDLGLLWLILRDYRDGLGEPMGADVSIGHGRRVLTRLEVVSAGTTSAELLEPFRELFDATQDQQAFDVLLTAEEGVA